MPRLKCYKPESLLEYISLPEQVGFWQTFQIKRHLKGCADCRKIETRVRSECAAYFAPEPEITTSLLRVYSKLQKDETLILKGWKLDTGKRTPTARQRLVNGGWAFRGGLALASLVMVGLVVSNSGLNNNDDSERLARRSEPKPPMAQIRIEQPGRVKVHYVEPELLQTMEFETTSARY